MGLRPYSRSTWQAMSATTRAMMAPTVRQVICSSLVTAVLEHWVASHATVSSNARVCREPCRGQGTAATVTVPVYVAGLSGSHNGVVPVAPA